MVVRSQNIEKEPPTHINRRDFIKVTSALGVAGGLLANLGWGELFSSLREYQEEYAWKQLLKDRLSVPMQWPVELSQDDVENHNFQSPLEIINGVLPLHGKHRLFYDSAFPYIVSEQEMSSFFNESIKNLRRVMNEENLPVAEAMVEVGGNILQKSSMYEKTLKLGALMSNKTFFAYTELLSEYISQTNESSWPTFERIIGRMSKNSLGVLQTDAKKVMNVAKRMVGLESHSEVSPTSFHMDPAAMYYAGIPDRRELLAEFAQKHSDEHATIFEQLQMVLAHKQKLTQGNKLTVSEYLAAFVRKAGGDVLRGLVDAIQYARTVTRTTYVESVGGMRVTDGVENDLMTKRVFSLANLIEDNLSPILPWDYLASVPAAYTSIAEAADQPILLIDQNNAGSIREQKVNLKDFQLRNRIGVIAHVLSEMLMCGCMDPSGVAASILIGYYGFPSISSASIEGQVNNGLATFPGIEMLVKGLDYYSLGTMIENVDQVTLATHGRIKFAADSMVVSQSSPIRKSILRCGGFPY